MEYKRNHFIPRFMIDYWVDPTTPHKGVHVRDIKQRRTYVSTGKGSKPFSFAIANDLYIHSASSQ